jgi:hypothetical protein
MRDAVLRGLWVYSYAAIIRVFKLIQKFEPQGE